MDEKPELTGAEIYEAMLRRISTLIYAADADPTSDEGLQELEALAEACEIYEARMHPNTDPF